MERKMKDVLKINVSLDECMTVEGRNQSICMIGFSGDADGPYFRGKILPWGVDTQRREPGKPGKLSARYMLKGVDYTGRSCKLFIENNGIEETDGIVRTRPQIVTDSPALAWMEQAKMRGEIESADGGVVIHITAEEELERGKCDFTENPVWIRSGMDGCNEMKIYGKLYVPVTTEKCPAVILSHGYNGSGDDFVRECEYFASHGIVALAIDFCGGSSRSRSRGSSLKMSLLTEKADLDAAVDYVKTLKQADPEQIFLFGGSQGGFVSALTAAGRPEEIRGLILYYPAFCIPDDWKKKFPGEEDIPETMEFWGLTLGEDYFHTARSLETFETIAGYGGPVLLIHGDEDEIVPLSYSVRAREVYKNAVLITLFAEGHGFTWEGGAVAATETLHFILKNHS